MKELLQKIRTVKEFNCRMFASPYQLTEHVLRWVDENNPQHYNKNHFLAFAPLTGEDINAAITYQKERGLKGFLLKAEQPLDEDLIQQFGLKAEEQLVMALLQKEKAHSWKWNPAIEIRDCQCSDIRKELMTACLSLSSNPTKQAWIRRAMDEALDAAQTHPEYHWMVACQNGQVVGRCYALHVHGCVQVEDLWVAPAARKQYIGTTLFRYVQEQFDGLFFCHTEAGDTPKEMYRKLGFEVVGRVYEYSMEWR